MGNTLCERRKYLILYIPFLLSISSECLTLVCQFAFNAVQNVYKMLVTFFLRLIFLLVGLIYPAIAAFLSKDLKELLNWVVYLIVLAFWEVLANVFFGWFPFYYGWKILLIVWLLPTVGNGSSFLYRIIIHPELQSVCTFEIPSTSDGLRVLVIENWIKPIKVDQIADMIIGGALGALGLFCAIGVTSALVAGRN